MDTSIGVLDSRLFLSKEDFAVWDCHTEGKGVFDGKPHFHDFYELSYFYGGEGTYTVNGVSYPARAGLLTLATPSDYHMLSVGQGKSLHYYNVIFREGFLSETVTSPIYRKRRPTVLQPEGEDRERFFAAMREIFEDYVRESQEYTPPLTARLVKNGVESLVIRMLARLGEGERGLSESEDETVRRALLYVREHYRERLTLPEVAQAVERSPGYFSGYFHEKMKIPFSEYLLRFRLLAAASYVSSGDLPLKEIAYLHGFRSFGYFSSTFKSYFGLSPRDYRAASRR
ncbi:MAG: helix-turn-helix transcriptional regulator [Clostridia bacterium]|nr:helix-turn-helix transcriptional regulator [Clostridia bacterium]